MCRSWEQALQEHGASLLLLLDLLPIVLCFSLSPSLPFFFFSFLKSHSRGERKCEYSTREEKVWLLHCLYWQREPGASECSDCAASGTGGSFTLGEWGFPAPK